MKTKQILTAGAIALSMILTGCSASSTGTKDTKSSSEENFSDNLLENGDVVKNKEERTLYYTVKENDKLDVKIGLQDQDKTFVFKDVDTTASTTNTSSNKNNTSSSKPSNSSNSSNSNSSKPAEHTHNWVAQYKTVNVPEKGHNEQVLVQAAYDEQVPITEMKEICVGNQSGLQINGDPNEYLLNNSNGDSGWHSEWRETVVGYKTVHHEAVYETRYVVDSPATTKQELTGYKCSGCGKTKAN